MESSQTSSSTCAWAARWSSASASPTNSRLGCAPVWSTRSSSSRPAESPTTGAWRGSGSAISARPSHPYRDSAAVTLVLETPRLELRMLLAGDLDALHPLYQDPEVGR